MPTTFRPKLFTLLRTGYTINDLMKDLTAGVIVGIVALPLAIAFAIASGVKPEQGLYTAVIAGFFISLFGGSRVQISGPTGAFIVVVYGVVQQYGYSGLAAATLLAGVMLVLMGLARFGKFLKFIPYPLTIGFTSGIAVIIFSSQIKDFLGLTAEKVPAAFIEKLILFVEVIGTFNPWAFCIAIASLLVIIGLPRVTPKVPSSLVAIILFTAVVQIFHLPVDTIGSRFGSVPSSLPMPHLPDIDLGVIRQVFSAAFTIALLGAIESLLSASVADGMIGKQHRSNMELVALGIGNILSPLFQGIPATGAIARTATNVKLGGRTPVAGLVHASTLLLIMLFFGAWASLIPMPVLSAILVYVAYNMSEWRTFIRMLKMPAADVAIMVITFLLTVLIDLTVAIEVGVVLAAFFFMQQMANATQVALIKKEFADVDPEEQEDDKPVTPDMIPRGVEVFELYGSLFFAAIEQFRSAIRQMEEKPRVIIIRTRNLLAIDATGLNEIEDFHARAKKDGITLMISGIHKQPLNAMIRSGLYDKIGEGCVFGDIYGALAKAAEIIGHQPEKRGVWTR